MAEVVMGQPESSSPPIASFRASAFRVKGPSDRPVCASCGKVALHCRVGPSADGGSLVIACASRRCQRVFCVIRGLPSFPKASRASGAGSAARSVDLAAVVGSLVQPAASEASEPPPFVPGSFLAS